MKILALLAIAALLATGPVISPAADSGDDVLTLFDEFVSAAAAASQCASPSNDVAARFLSNFQWVSTHATLELGRRSPDVSNDEVTQALARRSQAVKAQTHALVKAEGCESPGVLELVKRFAVQSIWKRSESP